VPESAPGSQIFQGAEAGAQLVVAQAVLAIERSQKLLGGAFPLLPVAIHAARHQVPIEIAAGLRPRHNMVNAPSFACDWAQTIKAVAALAGVNGLAQRPRSQEILLSEVEKRRMPRGLADRPRSWWRVRREPPRGAARAPGDGLGCCVRSSATRLAKSSGARRRVRSCRRHQRHGPAKESRIGIASCLPGGYAGKDASKQLGRSRKSLAWTTAGLQNLSWRSPNKEKAPTGVGAHLSTGTSVPD
jgi:hypothetical protein